MASEETDTGVEDLCGLCRIGRFNQSVIVRSKQTNKSYLVYRCSKIDCSNFKYLPIDDSGNNNENK